MAEHNVIGEIAPRLRTQVITEAPYIFIKQEDPENGEESVVSIHIDATQEFLTLLAVARNAIEKERAKAAETLKSEGKAKSK